MLSFCFGLIELFGSKQNSLEEKMGRDDKRTRKRKGSSSSESSVDSVENERRKDLKERDEFATRLKEKDSGATRKVLEVCFNNCVI